MTIPIKITITMITRMKDFPNQILGYSYSSIGVGVDMMMMMMMYQDDNE